MSTQLIYHELTDLNDVLLLPWLDLYETAFPECEKVLVSNHLGALKRRARSKDRSHILLAVLNDQSEFVGMARYQLLPEDRVSVLWYLAVQPALRSSGIGARVYQHILKELDPAVFRALVFEVEIPEDQPDEVRRQYARRRIQFYRRQGARLLRGIHYLQYVGAHRPPTPMHLMAHPLGPLSPREAYDLARLVYQDALEPRGEPALE